MKFVTYNLFRTPIVASKKETQKTQCRAFSSNHNLIKPIWDQMLKFSMQKRELKHDTGIELIYIVSTRFGNKGRDTRVHVAIK